MKSFSYLLICCLIIFSCNPNPSTEEKVKNTGPDTTAVSQDSQAPPPAANFPILKLTKANYNILRAYPGNQLVFQFFYFGSPDSISPRLAAYSMRQGHRNIQDIDRDKYQKILDTSGISSEPLTGRDQYLGDLQETFQNFQKLKRDANPGNAENYTHFLFTPMYDPTNKHIIYEVEVIPTVAVTKVSLKLNPSPPFSAN